MPIIYSNLIPPPYFMRERFRNMHNKSMNRTDDNIQVNQINFAEYVAREGVIT